MTDRRTTHQAREDDRNGGILIWLDGRLLPREQALVSVYDSGFMLGGGVCEGPRLHDGTRAFLDEHLDRLFEAARAIDLGVTRKELETAISETQAANGMVTGARPRAS